MKAKLLIIISIVFSTTAFSQSVKTLEYNVGSGLFTGLLPFDQPFNLKLINIPRDADSLRVKLIEVPKKNYHQISRWKKEKGKNWKILTAEDAINWKPDGIESFQFLLDSMVKGKTFTDTFYTLAVPFYLKPESKYLIKIECFTKQALTDAETEALVTDIKRNGDYKSLINELVTENINDPDASSKDWGPSSIRLQNIAQQAVKAKHSNYIVNEINYETQLEKFSDFFTGIKNLIPGFVELNGNIENALNKKTNDTIAQVFERHKKIQEQAAGINLQKVKETDVVYKNFIKQLNSVLYSDSLLLNKPGRPFIKVARNNIITAVKNARAKQLSGATLKNSIAQQLNGIHELIYEYLQKNDQAALDAATQRHNGLKALLQRINWTDLKVNSAEYKNFMQRANDALSKDSVLMPGEEDIITDKKRNIARDMKDAIDAIRAYNDGLARWTALNTFNQATVASTNSESLLEQAKLHVTFDLGYAYVWQVDRGNAYAGINIYFRSIDTSLPLKNYKRSFIDFIGSRTSLLVGLSVQSIQKDSVRKGLIGSNALVTGLGFRLLPWFKINGGAYMYYLYSRNPLRTKNDYSFKASPFVSLSIDFNLSSFFDTFGNGSIANIFKK